MLGTLSADRLKAMNEKVKSFVKNSLLVLIGVAILGWLIWYTGPERLLASFLSISLYWASLSMVLVLVFYWFRAFRWALLLRPVKDHISLSKAFWITLIGYMTNFLSGTRVGGEFLRAFLMKLKEDIGFFEAFSSVCVERVLDLLGIVAIGAVSILLIPSNIDLPRWFIDSLRLVGFLVLIALLGLVAGTRKEAALLGLLDHILSLIRLPEKWRMTLLDFSKALIMGARGIGGEPVSLILIFSSTMLIWLLQALSIYAMFLAFGLSLSFGLVLLGSMVFQLTFILPAPPGLAGTYEGAFVGIFVALGLRIEAVLPMSLLNHFIFLSLISLLGWVGMAKMGLSLKQLRNIRKQ